MSRLITGASVGALLLAFFGHGVAAVADPATGQAPSASSQALPPLEIFGRLPAVRLVTLSPNGKLLAMEEDKGGVRQVVIFEADGGKTRHTVAIDAAVTLVDTHPRAAGTRDVPGEAPAMT